MRNPVQLVAQFLFLPEAELCEYAKQHQEKYSIDVSNGKLYIGNFHVDAFVEDFTAEHKELCDKTYAETVRRLNAK